MSVLILLFTLIGWFLISFFLLEIPWIVFFGIFTTMALYVATLLEKVS